MGLSASECQATRAGPYVWCPASVMQAPAIGSERPNRKRWMTLAARFGPFIWEACHKPEFRRRCELTPPQAPRTVATRAATTSWGSGGTHPKIGWFQGRVFLRSQSQRVARTGRQQHSWWIQQRIGNRHPPSQRRWLSSCRHLHSRAAAPSGGGRHDRNQFPCTAGPSTAGSYACPRQCRRATHPGANPGATTPVSQALLRPTGHHGHRRTHTKTTAPQRGPEQNLEIITQ